MRAWRGLFRCFRRGNAERQERYAQDGYYDQPGGKAALSEGVQLHYLRLPHGGILLKVVRAPRRQPSSFRS